MALDVEKLALRFIGQIYEAGTRPEGWRELLANLAKLYGATTASLTLEEPHLKSAVPICLHVDDTEVRRYEQHFGSVNVFVLGTLKELLLRRTVVSQDLVPNQIALASEYWNDFMRPIGAFFHIGAQVLGGAGYLSLFSLGRTRQAGPYRSDEIQLIDLLIPHMRRSFQIHQQLAAARVWEGAASHLSNAVVMVSRSLKVLQGNTAAQRLLGKKDGLQLGMGDTLQASVGQQRELAELITRVSRLTGSLQAPASENWLAVRRPSSKPAYVVRALPAPCAPFLAGMNAPAALLIITDPDEEPRNAQQVWARLFGLTAAEARVAGVLASGESLDSACEVLRIKKTTARAHLRHLFDKLGVSRQAEMVALLHRSL